MSKKLTEKQVESLPFVEWLFSGTSPVTGSDQETVIAVSLVRLAARSPGTRIGYASTRLTSFAREEMIDKVFALAQADTRLCNKVRRDKNGFVLMLPAPINNWLPAVPKDT